MNISLILIFCFQNSAAEQLVKAQAAHRQVSLTGFTRARATLQVTAEVAGKCVRVTRDIGQAIGNDGLFAQLDDTFTRLELEANGAEQERLQSRIDYLKRDVARYEDLLQRQTISQSQHDDLSQQLDQAQLDKKALGVQAKILRERLKRFGLTAPAGWLVMKRMVEPGQWVNMGTAVAQVGDYGRLMVPFALETDVYRQLLADPEGYRLELASNGQLLEGRPGRVSPAYDADTRKILVEMEIHDGLPENRGGLRVLLHLNVGEAEGIVELPRRAIEMRYDTWWVTHEDGRRERVVLLGSVESDRVRVQGKQLRAGDAIRLIRDDL